MEWGQVQEGVASAEGGVELGGVWGLAEEKDWDSKLSYLFTSYLCCIALIMHFSAFTNLLRIIQSKWVEKS